MKTRLAMLMIMVMATGMSNAQSTFYFQNFYGPGGAIVDAPVFDAIGNRLSGAGYFAELYGGATLDSLQPLVNYTSRLRTIRTFGTGVSAGHMTGYAAGSGGTGLVADTVGPGGMAYLQMMAWDASLGSTYEAAAAQGVGGYGESNVLYLRGGDPTVVPPTTPTALSGLQSFSLLPVPEPSSTALWLLGIGLAAGLNCKWRKLKT